MIYVTKPFSPPIDEYVAELQKIWDRNYFTNNGPVVQDLEKRLTEYLGLEHLSFVTNGTISLQIMLEILPIKGEILTTPFSYIATASSILWQNFTPIFVDIDDATFNVKPENIEDKISSKTVGMMFTHCFGVPCDVESIEKIGNKHSIPVFYDAAHAFGVKYRGKSILNFGRMSSLSFHSTKLFHTVEGGAIVSANKKDHRLVQLKRNFGHNGPETFDSIGINGKNSEFHAAMGIVNLKYINSILERRKIQYLQYLNGLKTNSKIKFQFIPTNVEYNHAYFPIVLESEEVVIELMKILESNEISTRRYFYPSMNTLSIFGESQSLCPISEKIAERILCLPLYHELKDEEIDSIIETIQSVL